MSARWPPVGGKASRTSRAAIGLALVISAVLAAALLGSSIPAHAGLEVLRESYAPSTWDTSFANVYAGMGAGQSFVAHSDFLVTHLELYLFDQPQGSTSDLLQVSVAADAGGRPGSVLGTSAQEGQTNWSWVPFAFYPWVPLSMNQRYWIVAADAQPRPRGYEWASNQPGDYLYGEAEWYDPTMGTWSSGRGADLFFRVYGISGPAFALEVRPDALPVDPGATVTADVWLNNSGNEPSGVSTLSLGLSTDLIYMGDTASAIGGTQTAPLTWGFDRISVGPHHLAVWLQVSSDGHYFDGESLAATFWFNYTDPSGAPQTPLQATATVTVLVPVIRLTAEASPLHVDPGQTLNYSVAFQNFGSGRAADVWVNASSGPRLTLLSDTAATAGATTVGPYAWRFTNVTDQRYAFNVSGRADPAAWPGDRVDLLLNVSYTDARGHFLDRCAVVASASIHGPSIVVSTGLGRSDPRPDDGISLFVYANNTGDEVASRVWINGTLPSGTVLVSVQPALSLLGNGSFAYIGVDAAPGPYTITFRLLVPSDALPGEALVAEVDLAVANATGRMLRPSSASATARVITPRFDLVLQAAASSTVHPGDRLDLVLIANNTGNEAAVRVWLNLTLSPSMLVVNSSRPWSGSEGQTYIWVFSGFAPGAASLHLTLEVSARLTDQEHVLNRLNLTYERADGAIVVGGTVATSFVGSVSAVMPTWEMALLWAAVLASLFLLFLLLAYMDLLPHRRTTIDDVFLLHNSGILICHYSTTLRPDVDSDIASGMLMAVRNFVADAFRNKDGALQELRYGDYRIHMAQGKHAILVVFTRGGMSRGLTLKMSEVLESIEDRYAAVLEAWSGRTEDFKGVEEVLLKLVES